MSDKKIFVEGGGETSNTKSRCREGFHKLLEKANPAFKAFQCVPKGSREKAYKAFRDEYRKGNCSFLGLLVDSEEPVKDIDQPWAHLAVHDKWARPAGATDDQVFLMTTCMETWIVADRAALQTHYKGKLRPAILPPLINLEMRNRHDVHDKLEAATNDCKNAFHKGERSFAVLTVVDPTTLAKYLPSFVRMVAVLNTKL